MEPDEAERAQDAEHVQDAVAEHDQDAEHDQRSSSWGWGGDFPGDSGDHGKSNSWSSEVTEDVDARHINGQRHAVCSREQVGFSVG